VRHGEIKRGYLGIRSQAVDIPGASQEALNREQATGLLIMSVERNSPASQGGLMVGDILVAVDGKPILYHDELFARLNGDVVGRATPLEILRGGRPETVSIVIGARE